MNCEQCQESISLFLDNELDRENSSRVRAHLALCVGCAKVCEEFALILDFCALVEDEKTISSPPPNSKALWCRINNIIECEIEPEVRRQSPPTAVETGFVARIRRNSWKFSFSQVLTSVLGIALVSSLLTFVGFKNYAANGAAATSEAVAPSVFETILGKVGLVETAENIRERRVSEQQTAIDYWNRRVEARRVNWNNHLRQAFDRNLSEVNQVVFEYDRILRENPQDELSGEMLDSALNEKMELLREFSDL